MFQLSYVIPLGSFQLEFVVRVVYESTEGFPGIQGFQGSLLHHDRENSLFQLSFVIPLVPFQLEFVVNVDYESSWQVFEGPADYFQIPQDRVATHQRITE